VRSVNRSFWGAWLFVLVLVPRAGAEVAVVREQARLREGPAKATRALGDVPPGTQLEILGESEGWKQVLSPDGRRGYVWGEHLATALEARTPEPSRPADAARKAEPETSSLRAAVDELRAEVSALRDRPAASADDVARLRAEVDRIGGVTRELARRLDERVRPAPVDPPASSGVAGIAWVFLGAGVLLGWLWNRAARRRDHRQRSRLKL
jgi:Bacterial SH3 domain